MRNLDWFEKSLNNLPPFGLFRLFRNGRLKSSVAMQSGNRIVRWADSDAWLPMPVLVRLA